MKRRIFSAAAAASALSLGLPASGQDRTLKLIVGFAPGGSSDQLTRILADKLRASLGQNVVVENKPGASGRVSMAELKRLPPDGQTLVMATSGTLVVAPWLYPNLPYDSVKDFTPIARAASFDFALTIGPAGPQRDIKHVLAWMKANPDKANFATSGAGTLGHFTGVLLSQTTGVNLTHIPYKGGAPAAQDLVAGLLPMMVDTASETLEHHKAGRVRIVAVTGQERSSALPDVPTLKEAGINMTADGYFALYGPAGMQPAVVQRIERAVAEALRAQDARDKISALGLMPDYLDSAGLKKLQAEQLKRWEQPVKASGFKPD
ncbi:tripartite tricarboxylate transporter substrate binding protein [Acidovorax sp. Root217]|uniref:Bug family tripartite tricarboxylate transporter substrate binding protein n=1 Tax=Acidovorax sp. Root217 TaxID=1736492 RepID=UPI00070D470F|nr:tripartite tricarboxylate transporter substrate-binding protein [Acidovorax sp. Root217]KRC21938.1 ABC transporter substrate-binding protein [Acidovorax sp. Root217]